MDQALRALVRARASDACEYCRLPQTSSAFVQFHIEHVIARQHGGLTEAQNLALACSYCNFHKGPNIAALDPEDGVLVPLFHPRRDTWTVHFAWDETMIVGQTSVGRATARILGMNDWQRLELREALKRSGLGFSA